jgi:hypothetical protein
MLAVAQSNAASIAAAMQSWRDACGDPNPDLALGYLVDAVATGNIDVRKACLRQILASDNSDLRSSALRVVIATLPLIRFRVGAPEADDRLNSSDARIQKSISTGLVFQSSGGNADTGTATWFPLIANPAASQELQGTVTVLGSGVIWAGRAQYANIRDDCKLTAELDTETHLIGQFQCGTGYLFPVSASMLD